MNILGTHPSVEAAQIPLDSLASNAHISDSAKVAEVSRQFEAVLLRQILQDIRKPMLAPAQGDATANGVYDDMITNQMAESISRSGGFGLAQSLSGQLTHQVLPQHPSLPPAHFTSTKKARSNEPSRK